jgi:cysteine desulfurase
VSAPLYLDANASEPLRPEARAAALAALDAAGNPASIHAAGRAARRLLEQARESVAARFGVAPDSVVFTSGGTESAALAMARIGAGRRVLAGATEHAAVLAQRPATLPVRPDGTLDLDALDAALDGPPALVCAMAANNETGVLHPLEAIAERCRAAGASLFVDGCQAAGRVPIPPVWDALAISGHKLGGPLGAGALLLRQDGPGPSLILGGGQERGRRGGTPGLPAIAGLAAALAASREAEAARLARLRDAIEAGVASLARVVGAAAPRLPNTTSLLLPGVAAETQVIALDLAGLRVSAGAACSSGKVAASHVLAAMGEDAASAIRVSLPWDAPEDAPARFLDAYRAMAARLSRG